MNPVQFPNVLILKDEGLHNDIRSFTLVDDYYFLSSIGTIKVPAGFTTDGASIPRLFWSIFSPYGDCFGAAVIHDYLYNVKNDFSRKQADKIFLEGMKLLSVSYLRRNTVYYSVRMFGKIAYKNK